MACWPQPRHSHHHWLLRVIPPCYPQPAISHRSPTLIKCFVGPSLVVARGVTAKWPQGHRKMTPLIIAKLPPEHCKITTRSLQNYPHVIAKLPPGHCRMTPRSLQNEPQVIAKWPPGHCKMTPRSSQNDPKAIAKWTPDHGKMTPRSPQNYPWVMSKWSLGHHKMTPGSFAKWFRGHRRYSSREVVGNLASLI